MKVDDKVVIFKGLNAGPLGVGIVKEFSIDGKFVYLEVPGNNELQIESCHACYPLAMIPRLKELSEKFKVVLAQQDAIYNELLEMGRQR